MRIHSKRAKFILEQTFTSKLKEYCPLLIIIYSLFYYYSNKHIQFSTQVIFKEDLIQNEVINVGYTVIKEESKSKDKLLIINQHNQKLKIILIFSHEQQAINIQ
ncbi:hypothetical protein pb186bvf_009587 [Paramecium bursaria]